jgi:hypothetical protein
MDIKFKFAVYKQVVGNYCEYLLLIGYAEAIDRNNACLQFRDGEYQNDFLTAKKVI